jgi:hypothetical protein
MGKRTAPKKRAAPVADKRLRDEFRDYRQFMDGRLGVMCEQIAAGHERIGVLLALGRALSRAAGDDKIRDLLGAIREEAGRHGPPEPATLLKMPLHCRCGMPCVLAGAGCHGKVLPLDSDEDRGPHACTTHMLEAPDGTRSVVEVTAIPGNPATDD